MRLPAFNLTVHTHNAAPSPACLATSEIQVKTRGKARAPQRGASLIETSIAVGLVGIAVFASASTFGSNISLTVSRGIIPSIGGGLASDSSNESPNSGKPGPQSPSEPQAPASGSADLVGGVGVVDEGGDKGAVGGVVGEPEDVDNGSNSSPPYDDGSLVGGIDAGPPVYDDGAGMDYGLGSSSAGDWNEFVGGIDMMPETVGEEGAGEDYGLSSSSEDDAYSLVGGEMIPGTGGGQASSASSSFYMGPVGYGPGGMGPNPSSGSQYDPGSYYSRVGGGLGMPPLPGY